MIPGVVNAIYPQSGQGALITGSYGLVFVTLGSQSPGELRTPDRILGIDASGRAWLSPEDGSSISSWDGSRTQSYDSADGWILNAAFFDPPLGGSRLVNGRPGELWLATLGDLRRFDGTRWRIFTPVESGLRRTRAASVNTAFTLAVHPITGAVMAGSCDWRGQNPLDGGAVRLFDGKTWSDAGFPESNPCLTGLQAAPDGTIYAAAANRIWRIQGGGSWQGLPLPDLPAGTRYGLVEQLTLDLQGRLWPLIQLTDAGGAVTGKVRLMPDNGGWKVIRELDQLADQQLLFLPGGAVWALEQGRVYSLEAAGTWTEQANLNFRAGGADPDGGIWLVTDVDTVPVVWRAQP
jgi:hypothetical protein